MLRVSIHLQGLQISDDVQSRGFESRRIGSGQRDCETRLLCSLDFNQGGTPHAASGLFSTGSRRHCRSSPRTGGQLISDEAGWSSVHACVCGRMRPSTGCHTMFGGCQLSFLIFRISLGSFCAVEFMLNWKMAMFY
jgi:hypothetical protein